MVKLESLHCFTFVCLFHLWLHVFAVFFPTAFTRWLKHTLGIHIKSETQAEWSRYCSVWSVQTTPLHVCQQTEQLNVQQVDKLSLPSSLKFTGVTVLFVLACALVVFFFFFSLPPVFLVPPFSFNGLSSPGWRLFTQCERFQDSLSVLVFLAGRQILFRLASNCVNLYFQSNYPKIDKKYECE